MNVIAEFIRFDQPHETKVEDNGKQTWFAWNTT